MIAINVDGAESTWDLYSPTTLYKQCSYYNPSLSNTTHDVLIKFTGMKNGASSGYRVTLDAIDITGYLEQAPVLTRYQQNDAHFAYTGGWTTSPTNWSASGGSFAYANGPGSSMNISFAAVDSPYLTLIATTGPYFGKLQLSLDGSILIPVDLYSPYTRYKQRVYTTGFLSAGHHTLSIYWTGAKNPASAGTTIDLDAVDIFDTLGSTTAATPISWRYQQNDPRITYLGSWNTALTWSASGGSYTRTSVKGGGALVRFTGTAITLVGTMGPLFGHVQMTLDGSTEIWDFYSTTVLYKQPVYSKAGLANTTHNLVIRCMGDEWWSPGYTIDVDALDITGYLEQAPTTTRYQQDNLALAYSGIWSTASTWSASGGSYAASSDPTATLTITFNGRYLAWVTKTAPWYGKASVALDGGIAVEADLYSSTIQWKRTVYSTGVLADGLHTLVIKYTGLKNAHSSGTSISADAFDIVGSL